MITQIKLKNWRSHEDTSLNFSEGTNGLIGLMGGGKTSVMSAICFALFGTFPELQSRKVKLEDIIMKKPKQKQTAEVELTFEIDKDEYTVKRKIEKNRTSHAEIRKNKQLLEAPQSQKVTEELQKVLKIDYDLFTRAVYSEQDSIDMFLTIPKGQRMKKIDELLAIDKFDKARSSVISLKNKCKTAAAEKQKLVLELKASETYNINQIENEKNMIQKQKEEREQYLEKTQATRQELETRISNLKDQLKKIQGNEQELKTSVALLSSIRADIEKLKPEMMQFSELTDEQLNQKLSALAEEEILHKDNLVSENNKLDSLKTVIALKQAKLKLLETEKIPKLKQEKKQKQDAENLLKKTSPEKLSKKLKDEQEFLEKTNNLLQKAIITQDEINKSLEELKAAGASCPVCDQKLSDKKKQQIIRNKKVLFKRLEKEQEKHRLKVNEIKKEIQKIETEIKKLELLEHAISDITDIINQLKFAQGSFVKIGQEIGEHETERKMLEKALSILKTRSEQLRTEFEEIKKIIAIRKEIEEKTKRSRQLEWNISELNREKQKFSLFSPESLDMLEKELYNIVSVQSSIKAKITGLSSLMEEKEKMLSELRAKQAVIDKYANEVRRLEAITDQLYLLETALFSTQTQLRKNFISTVNQAMGSIWNDIYPYKDFYGCRLGIKHGDYILQLQDSTGWLNVDGIVSGGERSMACLALRIAFSLILAPQLRWLVLDEPTHNLDSRAVNDLADVLREKISEFVDQVFLITHDPSLENAVSGYLYRLEREKKEDSPTKVICISRPDDL